MSNRIRTALCVAVVGVVLSAALAWAAAVRHYAGTVKPGGTIKVTTAFLKGQLVVRHFSISGVPIHCSTSSGSVPPASDGSGPGANISVSNRRFHYRFLGGDMGLSDTVKGRFNANFSRATGTVTFNGNIYPIDGGCHSGTDTWTAH